MRLLLDPNVLGQIGHPRCHQDVRAWFVRAVFVHEMLVPEIADFQSILLISQTLANQKLDEPLVLNGIIKRFGTSVTIGRRSRR